MEIIFVPLIYSGLQTTATLHHWIRQYEITSKSNAYLIFIT